MGGGVERQPVRRIAETSESRAARRVRTGVREWLRRMGTVAGVGVRDFRAESMAVWRKFE